MREPQPGITRELQVGVFIFSACLVIAAFSFRITDTPIFRRGTSLTTYLQDATGVFKKSKVKLAGIDIGIIENIELEDGRAKLTLIIDKGVEIPHDAHIIPRPLGILGDKYLEVVLPPKKSPAQDSQSSTEPAGHEKGIFKSLMESNLAWGQSQNSTANYKAGDVIESKNSAATIDDLTRQMGSIGQDLKAVSSELRKVMEGSNDAKSPLGKTLKNTEALTDQLNNVVKENRGEFKELIQSLHRTSQKIEESLEGLKSSELKKDLSRLTQSAANLSKSLENVERITSKIDKGEGTLGKLVNDTETVDELNKTLRSVNGLVTRATRTLAMVDMKGEYLSKFSETKTSFSVEIYPQEDTGYIASVIVDPFGSIERVVTTTAVDGGPTSTETKLTQNRDGLRFSLQYYKKVWNMAFRLGVFESRGGLGVSYYPTGDGLELGAEIFDFSRDNENPHLKAYLRVPFLNYFYAHVGGYELLAKSNEFSLGYQKSFYAGIGIRFSDDDLKTLTIFPSLR
jgi:phospholipid/cholesterol/gamma-HCH transport system substrate-binding protein